MKYELDKDKACLGDEIFPYPLKLTWDEDTIYLTVLRIPTFEEIAAASHGVGGTPPSAIEFAQNLYLTVDTLHTSNHHNEFSRRNENGYGRKFANVCQIYYNNLEEGDIYEFDIHSCMTSLQRNLEEELAGTNPNIYFTVRGNFRYLYSNSTYVHTRFNSNTATIIYNP